MTANDAAAIMEKAKAAGIPDWMAARVIGVSRAAINHWVTGKYSISEQRSNQLLALSQSIDYHTARGAFPVTPKELMWQGLLAITDEVNQ